MTGADKAVLALARDALLHAAHTCRYHGSDFGKLGTEVYEVGLPRCESCRQPWRVTRALAAIERVMPS